MKLGKMLAVLGLSALGVAMSPGREARGQQMSDPFPVWDKRISASQRFEPRLRTLGIPGAYLDLETGLLWTARPRDGAVQIWPTAFDFCVRLRVGASLEGTDRGGWRLPQIEELQSLLPLPAGSPITHPANASFWSATTVPGLRGEAVYTLSPNGLQTTAKDQPAGMSTWCVRGGRGVNPAP
jgi:hypothetical protein